jgi:hypothetical protein
MLDENSPRILDAPARSAGVLRACVDQGWIHWRLHPLDLMRSRRPRREAERVYGCRMANSSLLTVFGEPPEARFRVSSLVVSLLLHAGFFGLLTLRLFETHRLLERFPSERFAVRFVEFHSTERQIPAPGSGADRALAVHEPGSAGGAAAAPAVTRLTPSRMPASQTLIQPDIQPRVTISETTPIPLVVVWTGDKPVVKRLVPANPQTASISAVQPSLDAPIKEDDIADLKLASSALVTRGPAAKPSTTSPIVVSGTEELKKVPETTSTSADPPTPGRVISLSDVRVAEGIVAIPVANQTAKASPGLLIPGQLQKPARAGDGKAEAQGAAAGKSAGEGSGKADEASGKQGDAAGSNAGAATASGALSQRSSVVSGPGAPSGAQPAAVRISLPRDGQFGVVVFGSSVAEQYPETAEMWSGRMASTVYLHVGLARNWILQYALPRLVEAQGGERIDAPWPYEIVRPTLDPGDVNSDAVILHGFVNKDGRFDKLEVVFPAKLAQAPGWIAALNQWQFRPARQAGQAVPVEVLVIVPDQPE